MIRNVLKHYRLANDGAVSAGMQWYSAALAECERLSVIHPYSVDQIACAMAHLSPRLRWAQNKAKTAELLRTGTTYGMTAHIENAKRALRTSDPFSTFSPDAMKTYRFARNIIGDYQPVTVDMWATLAATGKRIDRLNRTQYREIEDVYQRAAKRVGYTPAQLQAIVWCVVRGTSE